MELLISQKINQPLNRTQFILFLICCSGIFFSCSPKNITSKYYYENEKVLDRIEETYKSLYPKGPFTVGFTDREFKTVSLEIIKDTLSYIYEFNINEPRLADTLKAYKLNADKITKLINEMNSIRCTWINQSDYYVDEKKHTLIFMSIKPVALKAPLAYAKYYILTYYEQPQYYDSEGNLLDKKTVRRLRKVKGDTFKRINSKVAYSISGTFR